MGRVCARPTPGRSVGAPSLRCVRFARRLLPTALVVVLAPLAACASGGSPAPAAGADPVLFEGQAIWDSQCASCHRQNGAGGRGPRLNDDRSLVRYDSVEAQVEFVRLGRGGMVGFGGRLTEDELVAVVRYTREVLANTQ